MIDLRSDTVTVPSRGMRAAMAEAEVGDDVLDGDPTTRKLEAEVAERVGHEAALFFPSGTQANQVAVGLHAAPGSEVIVESAAHLVHFEEAGAAANWGVQIRAVAGDRGVLAPDDVRVALDTDSTFHPPAALLCIENTHNAAGGRITDLERMHQLVEVARAHAVAVHLDGARLWNAAAALEVSPADLARPADTVMVSFSKGLGAPVGSCLAGPADLMARAVRLRRRLGGGMRQSGVLAAACRYGLEHHLPNLAQDHDHARMLADFLAGCPEVDVTRPDTNIVMVDLRVGDALSAAAGLREAGVLASVFGPTRLRFVTHLDVSGDQVRQAAGRVVEVLGRVESRA